MKWLTASERRARIKAGKSIEFEYCLGGKLVPVRLYKYTFDGKYLLRSKTGYKYEITKVSNVTAAPRSLKHSVYVVQINSDPKHIYVGQSTYTPKQRLLRHLAGDKEFESAKPFKKGAEGKLRPELYEYIPQFFDNLEAESTELTLAEHLRALGYKAEGPSIE